MTSQCYDFNLFAANPSYPWWHRCVHFMKFHQAKYDACTLSFDRYASIKVFLKKRKKEKGKKNVMNSLAGISEYIPKQTSPPRSFLSENMETLPSGAQTVDSFFIPLFLSTPYLIHLQILSAVFSKHILKRIFSTTSSTQMAQMW